MFIYGVLCFCDFSWHFCWVWTCPTTANPPGVDSADVRAAAVASQGSVLPRGGGRSGCAGGITENSRRIGRGGLDRRGGGRVQRGGRPAGGIAGISSLGQGVAGAPGTGRP